MLNLQPAFLMQLKWLNSVTVFVFCRTQTLWEFRERHGQYCNWNLHHQTLRCRSLWPTIGCWTDCWRSESSSECCRFHQGLCWVFWESYTAWISVILQTWSILLSFSRKCCWDLTHRNCHTKYRFSRTNLLVESVHLDFFLICPEWRFFFFFWWRAVT